MKPAFLYERSTFLILAFCLIFSYAAPVSAGKTDTYDVIKTRMRMDKELAKVTQKWEGKIPQEAYNPDGTVNKDHPGYKKTEVKWRAEMEAVRTKYNTSDPRWQKTTDIIKNQGLEGKILNTGSKPKSIKSDMDLTPQDYQSGKKLAKALGAKELSDKWVVKKSDITIWKTPPPETPSTAVSSAAEAGYTHAAKPGSDKFPTEGGMYSTTKGTKGIPDPEGAVLSNVKKASDGGLVGPPEKMDVHAVGKSTSKAAEATETKGGNSEFYKKADGVRQHLTPEEAGVTTFGNPEEVKQQERSNFQKDARSELNKSYRAGQKLSKDLDMERAKKVEKAQAAGKKNEVVETGLEQIKTKMSNQATLKELPPELAGELTGNPLTKTTNPDGSVTYKTPDGKSLSPSQAAEVVTGKAQTEVVKATNAASEEVKPGEKGMSPRMKVAGGLVIAYGVHEGAMRGAEKAVEEEQSGDSSLKTIAKATIYGVTYASGIADAWETGQKAGEESMTQYEKDKAARRRVHIGRGRHPHGEVREDPSWAWAKIRGVGTGVWRFAKGMTWDQLAKGVEALQEGAGLIGDMYEASKSEMQAREMQEQKAKKEADISYDPRLDANFAPKDTGGGAFDIAQAERFSKEFQESRGGGNKTTTTQAPQNVMKQPESYTTDPGAKPDASGGTQQPPFYPYPPGYSPESGQPGPRIPWEGLVPPSSGHRGKTKSGSQSQKGGTSSPHETSGGSSSETSSRPPQSGSGGHVKEPPCTQEITCPAWARGYECGVAKRRDPTVQCIMNQQQVGNCYYRAWEEGMRRGMGLTNSPKPGGC